MRIRSHHDLAGALVTSLLLGRPWWSTTSPTCLPLSVFTITSDQQRQRRVACVEGRLAARAGEAQRVARQRLAAHAATQGTRGLSLSGVRGHVGYAQDVCGEGSRA